MNFLEELAAEWYEYTGYFVRTNVRTRKRAMGGWDCEIDVLAFKPEAGELIHVETSGDALPWKKRQEQFEKKKFVFSRKEYETILGAPVKSVRKQAIEKRCQARYYAIVHRSAGESTAQPPQAPLDR